MGRKGIELATRYSYGSCAKTEELAIYYLLIDLLKFNSQKIETELKQRLKELKPYDYYVRISQLALIEDPFDYEVVRAYWLGNELLENFKPWGIPHHNLVILKEVENFPQHFGQWALISSINSCKVSVGLVKNINQGQLMVEAEMLVRENRKVFLKKQEVIIKKGLLQNVKVGNVVTFHWQEAREIIEIEETRHLQWVNQILIQALKER